MTAVEVTWRCQDDKCGENGVGADSMKQAAAHVKATQHSARVSGKPLTPPGR